VHPLKELVRKSTLDRDYRSTLASLLSKLGELHIDVTKKDEAAGEIVAQCLTSLAATPFWHGWSDKLLFKIRRIDAFKTEVELYAIPNLFRYRTNKNERVIEVNELASRLFE
jgi:hypothetical protein